MSNNVPLDVWGEILVRLPAECLIRARAVCKGFRAVINDPCFVRAHTNKNHQHQQQQLFSSKIIIQSAGSRCSLDLESLIGGCTNDGHRSVAATPLDYYYTPAGLSVAACNGLVLTKNPLAIWNPLTHERLGLPRGFVKYLRAYGLGYDSTTDDYKAVVILGSRETRVYSLKSDSWRTIISNYRPPPYDEGVWWGPFGTGAFVCGVLNWLSVGKGGEYQDKIVALDVGTEKYSLLQMPKFGGHPPGMLLSVLSGCLALFDSRYRCCFDVWVMKVYGDNDSWIKLISLPRWERWTDFLRPVAFIMGEKFVFLQDSYGCFFLFDVETKSFKSVKIDGKDTYFLCPRQMLVGNIIRLHANCGDRVRKKATTTICTNDKDVAELVFCIRDAKRRFDVCSSQMGCPVKTKKMLPSYHKILAMCSLEGARAFIHRV